MSTPARDGDSYFDDLTPEKHWDGWTDFDTPWDREHRDGPPHPRHGGVFGRRADEVRIRRLGYSRGEVENMTPEEKRDEIREFKSKLTPEERRRRLERMEETLSEMTLEERRARLRRLTSKKEDVPLSERMGFGSDDEEEEDDEDVGQRQFFRRVRRLARRRGDLTLGYDDMNERLEKDRNDFDRSQDTRVSKFHNRQESRAQVFKRRENRRKRAWNILHNGGRQLESHFHAEGEAKIAGSVLASEGQTKRYKTVIGFSDDEVDQERNAAAKWSVEEYGLDFTKARESGGKLIIDELAIMEPFVVHEDIDVVQKSGKGNALIYAGGYKITVTAASIDLGGEHEEESAKCGSILLYGHYFIDRGEGSPISACLFTSRRWAVPDSKGNATFRLNLNDHYSKSKLTAKGEGKMIINHETKGIVSVSHTLEF